MNLEGKVAIITGAQRGIGKACAIKLAELGAKVVVTDLSVENCQKVVEEIKEKDKEAIAFKLDVSNYEEAREVVKKVLEQYKRIDILVNNAGIISLEGLDDISKIDKILDVNLKGVMYCTKAVLPLMVEQKYGKIVSISSIAALVSWAKIHTYSATKGGIIGFTKCLAGEVGPFNINVNAVAPGPIETLMLDQALKDMGLAREQIIPAIPKRRIGMPEDIANAVAFLVSDESDYITGQVLIVDGGYTAI
jgi:NAD(P)-dependent dehydrogenase (short-subunit alcohol dehydrogenase family)